MAVSIPDDPDWPADAVPAEHALRRWAVDQLPDHVRVLPGVHLTDLSDGQTDAEVDLVLVDPEWGVLCIEVKGGTIDYRAGRWVRRLQRNFKPIRDPVQQAQRAASKIRTVLDANLPVDHGIAVGWAVATPDCRLDAPAGGYLPDSKLIDALGADQLEPRIARCLKRFVAERYTP